MLAKLVSMGVDWHTEFRGISFSWRYLLQYRHREICPLGELVDFWRVFVHESKLARRPRDWRPTSGTRVTMFATMWA